MDLSFSHTSAAPQKILSYHAGAIVDCDVSPSSYLATTVGADGRVPLSSIRVYDLPKRSVLVEKRFCAPGSAVIWVPKKIDPKSKTIIAGFGDGVVRILQVGQSKRNDDYQQPAILADLELIQVLKPHSDAVRAMAYDERGKFFASSVKCPNRKAKEKGTFELFDVEPLSGFQMQSVAGEMRVREEAADKRAKYEQEKKARAEKLEEARRNGQVTDEDILQAESEEKRILQKLEEEIAMMVPIVPEVPSPIIQCMIDTKDNTSVWISLDDFDAGYLYKCPLTKLDPPPPMTAEEKAEEEARKEEIARRRKKGEVDFDLPHSALEKVLQRLKLLKPTQVARVRDSGYSPLRSWKFTNNGKRVIFGFKNGTVRVQLLKRPYEFSSFAGYWIMAFQDNDRGMVNREGPIETEDIDDPKADSIEGARKKAEWAKLVEQGEEKRRDTRRKVAELRMKFKRLKEQNEKLPEHMRIDLREYEILPRIRDHLMKERAAKLDLLYRETAFESRRYELALRKIIARYRDQLACELLVLKSFGTDHSVATMRANTLPSYHNLLLNCLRKEAEEEAKREAEKKRRAAEEGEVKLVSTSKAFVPRPSLSPYGYKKCRMQARTRVSTTTVHDLLFEDDCAVNTVMKEDMQRSMDLFTAGCANFQYNQNGFMHQPPPSAEYNAPRINLNGAKLKKRGSIRLSRKHAVTQHENRRLGCSTDLQSPSDLRRAAGLRRESPRYPPEHQSEDVQDRCLDDTPLRSGDLDNLLEPSQEAESIPSQLPPQITEAEMARQDCGHGSPGADRNPQHPRHAEANKEAGTQKKKQPSVVQEDTDRHKIKGARGLRLDRQLQFMQAAKAKREKRQAEWDALYAKKPPNNYEDPSDVAAIKYVRENMGDYKLKSSPNYTVPEHERRTAKKTRLVLLSTMRQLSERQADFNHRVLRLRDKKANIIQQLRLLDEELAKLADTLPESAIIVRLKISDLDDEEFPERHNWLSCMLYKCQIELMGSICRLFDITDEKLINFKNQIDPPPPAPNDAKKPPPPAPGTVEAEMSRPDAYKTMTVVMEEGRRVLWLPVEKLLTQETYFTLHLPFPHRPEITGLSVASLRPSEELTDHSIHRLLLDFKVQPDCVVVSRAIGLSEAEAQRKMDAETETTLPITNIPADSEVNEVDEKEGDDVEVGEDYADGMPQLTDQDPEGMSSNRSKRYLRTTSLEHAQQLRRQEQALYTRNFLLADAARLVRCFNADLRALRHQKVHLQFLLKRADLNLLTLYEEYKLLKDFEKSERGLAETYDQRLKERREVNAKVCTLVQEMNANLDGTKKVIEKLAEKETEIFEEFKAYLGDNHKFGDFLNKNEARQHAVEQTSRSSTPFVVVTCLPVRIGEEGDEDESSSSSEDSEWDESDEEDEDDMMDLDMCPPGCDQQDYDATIAFRERRLDVEDDTAEQKRLLDEQKKNAETLAKKQRAVEYALEQAVKDLQAFQIEKQSKLNVLERVVILRLDQITFYQDKGLPSDFGSALIFERENIHNLRHRIQELEDEKKGQRKAKKDAKAKHIMLQKHKKIFQVKKLRSVICFRSPTLPSIKTPTHSLNSQFSTKGQSISLKGLEIENMMKKCDLMMIDKFGRVDNLEKMETIRINPKIEEITARVLSLQAHIKAAEEKAEDELREARDCYIAEMRENTKLISKTVLLFHELQNLHGVLDKQQKNMVGSMPPYPMQS
ncbi:unnamed protein product [Schistocephalus solidus]|uniref:Uncharacterized protein n=1 Tax=Schistocephalus solidus TaxID=70667 RepID=A0A3P7E553_SCHSO|nr:unnamed protein product [Schistocephalus solidus]